MMITKLRCIIILIFLSLMAVACGKGSSEKRGGGGAQARDTYLRSCAACHGVDGEGQPAGGLRTPSLKREDALKQTDQQLFDWISNGGRNMPSFKNSLTEEQIKALVRFIREEIQGRKALP